MTPAARSRGLALALLFAGVAAGSLAAQEPELARSQRMLEDRAAVLETVRELLRSLGARDVDRLEALHLPTATTVAVRLDGESGYPTVRTVPQVVESIAEVTVPMVERIWDPEVRVAGDVASVWAPYDFYIDGSFSHCGHDAFQLVRIEGVWRLAAITYTVARPPECALHPDGPPAGAAPRP